MEIRRISKYSNMCLIKKEEASRILGEMLDEKIIQMVVGEEFVAVEFITHGFVESYLLENTKQGALMPTDKEAPFDAQPRKTQEQIDLETALDTVLNNDPMGKYDGYNLRVPFDRGDKDWIEWVLKHMHNKFIKDKVALIKASGYGQN